MRKFMKKALAISLAAAMVVQPLSVNFLNLAPKAVSAAPVTNSEAVPEPLSRVDAAKNNTEWQVGAKMPYFRYDTSPANHPNTYTGIESNLIAMDEGSVSYQNTYTGKKKESIDWDPKNVATMASNQSYIELAKGESITWTIKTGRGGDGVTVRYTLPDANGPTDAAGKPIGNVSNFSVSTSNNATVLGYDNEDTSRRYNTYMPGNKVKVTSDYAWQYFGYDNGKPSGGHPVDNPNGGTGAFAFDEVHFRLDKQLNGGDTITITNSGDYTLGIDFIETEYTEYIKAPDGAVIVPAGTHTQSELEGYITRAEAGSKIVYLAPGVHYMDETWILAAGGVKFTGAGIWYTKFQFTNSKDESGGICGEKGGWCRDIEFCHMYINSNLHSRYNQNANYKCFRDLFAQGTRIHDIWEEHFECGFWIGRYDNTAQYLQSDLSIYNCRIRNNYADGVNFCQGTRDSNVHNCNSRNNGDDGLAMWNDTKFQPDDEYNNIFCYNTIEFIWRAGGIAVYGGEGHKVYNNYIRDNVMAAGIHVTDGFDGPKYNNTTNITLSNNVIIRCGTHAGTWGEHFGALDIHGNVKNVTFENTEIYDSQSNAIYTTGGDSSVNVNNTIVFGVGANQLRENGGVSAHSAVVIRQEEGANIKYNNMIVKNIPTKNNEATAEMNWPYYASDASNLPKLSGDELKIGNLNYKFGINSDGTYTYSGGAYTANANADSFPGYDVTKGKKILKEGTEPETDPIQVTRDPNETLPTEAPTKKPFGPGVGDTELTSLEGSYSWQTGYKYQGQATVNGISNTQKYLVVTYTGDITSLRLGNNAESLFGWFNPNTTDNGKDKPFKTVAETELGATTTPNTVVIDLEASGFTPSFFSLFHKHTGGTGAAGSVTISKAWLTDTIPDLSDDDDETTKAQEPDTTKPQEPDTTKPQEPDTTKAPEPDTTKAPEPDTTKAQEITGDEVEIKGLSWANDKGSTELKEGDNVTFTVLLKNNSSKDVSSVNVKAVVDGSNTINHTYTGVLKAGDSVKVAFTRKWSATYGGHTVVVSADKSTRTKSFNVGKKEVTYNKVTGGYDLVVTDLDYEVQSGNRLLFTVTVTNIGDQNAPSNGNPIGVRVHMDGNQSGMLVWNDKHLSGLEAGRSVRLTMTDGSNGNTLEVSNGTHTATAWVNDQTNRYPDEVSFNNNQTDFTITLPSPTLIENPDEVDDLDNPVPDDPTKINISNSVKIEGYQISATLEGSRVVGSVEPTINGQKVKNWGLIYAVTNVGNETFDVTDNDMRVNPTNKYVVSLESTKDIGTSDTKLGASDTATYFVRTTMFTANNTLEYTSRYKVRAYAQLNDGSYVYSTVDTYSVYDVCDTLYQEKMMNNVKSHDFLYDKVLKVVKPDYKKVDYNWGNAIVGPGEI